MLYQTHALVHLQNIRFNIEKIRESVGNECKILIAVKANAYGHGAVRVSKMAERIGVDWLGVATVPECVELRQAGVSLPILKFSPAFPEEMEAALSNDLTLAVCDADNIRCLDDIARSMGRKARVHLKIDTGMGRVGVDPDDTLAMASDIIRNRKNIILEGAFTHLPISDAADTTFTRNQVASFRKLVVTLESELNYKIPLVHCANSGAILGHPEARLDMVRPGIMIYGYRPDPETPATIPLKPGLSFKTRVSFIKRVAEGTSIGYGRTWFAPENTYVATFPAGYADGFNRLFSNSGRVLINGRSYPVVGRVCMDQSMADLGTTTDVKVGDEVVLIGKSHDAEISAYEWEQKLKTITYEVTCQINSRVQRIYESEDTPV